MKVIIEGKLFGHFIKPNFTDKLSGEVIEGKPVLQLVTQSELKNGEIKSQLIDISIPKEKLPLYKGKESQTVQVPCNIFVKGEMTIYGV